MRRNADESEGHAIALARKTVAALSWDDRPLCEKGDLLSVAMIAAVRAHRSYDPSRGAWRTYVLWRVRGAVKDAMRSCMPLSRRNHARQQAGETLPPEVLPPVSLSDLLLLEDEGDRVTLEEGGRIPRAPNDVEREALARIEAEALWREVDLLPARWAYVLTRIFVDGATDAEIGGEMNRSESHIRQYQREALGRLRNPPGGSHG